MHTEPTDSEGPNLFETSKMLKIENNVFFSRERLDFEQMNILYNISDFCINISFAEGFGLTTLEAMMTGAPIIAAKTGGLTRQVINHKNGQQNGVALDIDVKTLVGSQSVPYIYEDYVSNKNISAGLMKLHTMWYKDPKKYKRLRKKVLKYAREEFSHENIVNLWHDSMLKAISDFKNKSNNPSWKIFEY